MLHTFHDPDENNYLLIETTGPNTSFIYRNTAGSNCWLSLTEHLTTTPQPDSDPENFRSWKHTNGFTHIYSARTLSAIHKFIYNHPELSV